jgi:cell shape-determining protein MreC
MLRRLYVFKMLLSVLSLIADIYSVDNTELFQYLDSSIDEVLNSITQSYSNLFNNYDSLFNEYKEIKRLSMELEASNKSLTVQALSLSDENKQMKAELSELEGYSDSALMVMVQDWLESHDDTININDFAKNFKMTPTRVEQILNRMAALGYIELRG